MKMYLSLVLFLVLTACSHGHKKRHWQQMDSDQDGKVSKEEYSTAHNNRFTEMDTDKDGFVTLAEKKFWKKRQCKRKD